MSNPGKFSTGAKDIGEAKQFSWEYPVPDSPFWNDLPFVVGRNFLTCYSPEEIAALPIDLDSSLDKNTKLELLLNILEEKAKNEDLVASPQTYYDVDYEGWENVWLGISTIQDLLERFDDQEMTVRMLCDRRKDKNNLSHFHSLSVILLRKQQFADAEKTEIPVLKWLEKLLGSDSPQALGSRRIIARAVWQMGRIEEAKEMFLEVKKLIEASGNGKYALYQAEQLQTTEEMISKLATGISPD
ncbi:hypothetical protein BX600DRAFT_447697 [Xylariales sp. PMI_506]|nr:hypothetical protein BX600DRAFT_447697 [Xylariales sp. PMI_506]